MPTTTTDAIAALLAQTGAAHGAYEESALGGRYDQEWPAWYAAYLLEHGLGDLLPETPSVDDLARTLQGLHEEHRQSGAGEAWPAFYARRLAGNGGS